MAAKVQRQDSWHLNAVPDVAHKPRILPKGLGPTYKSLRHEFRHLKGLPIVSMQWGAWAVAYKTGGRH